MSLFLQELRPYSLAKFTSSTLFFSGNFNAFHGTGTEPRSMTCEGDIHVAREKHHVSTGTFGTEVKPTPRRETCDGARAMSGPKLTAAAWAIQEEPCGPA